MDTNCRINGVAPLGQRQLPSAGCQVGPGIDNGGQARLERPRQYLVPVLVKLREIQVAMRVNHPLFVCNAWMSASTISWISCSKSTEGSQPSLACALPASPTSRSTSA